MTTGAAQIDIRHGCFVFAEFGNRAQRAVLIRQKGSLPERASNGADDLLRDIQSLLKESPTPEQGMRNLLWSLLNTKEFLLNY